MARRSNPPAHLLVAKSTFKRPTEGVLSELPEKSYAAGAPIETTEDQATELLRFSLAESAATGASALNPAITEDGKDFKHEVRRVLDPEAEGGFKAYVRLNEQGDAPAVEDADWFEVDRVSGKLASRSRKGLPSNKLVEPEAMPTASPAVPKAEAEAAK